MQKNGNLAEAATDAPRVESPIRRNKIRWGETAIKLWLAICAFISIVTTAAIVVLLISESLNFFEQVSPVDFFFGTNWEPLFQPCSFGVLELVWGTLIVTVGAAVMAIPTGLASAIYLSEYASDRVRSIIKPVLELLAGIPTVVYGYFALTFVTPVLQGVFPDVRVFNALSAVIVVGIMILPMIASLSDNALRAVPISLRQGAYALGATSYEVTTRVVVPAGLSGVMASFLLAISRAIGETMAVTLAAGATPNISLSMFESIQTMTAYIVQVSLGDTPNGSVVYQTLFAVATLLFAITLVINIVSQIILNRFREVYE
ncbi:MAG TPA: phosphate ABC transporter permease subunit PstC [Gammaproteobacteria bacterium]|jgi:phosphate transport system permease protein|nr:phosphate ABC transporter permease subunit PstC [Gammaproteobacteria bacterium]MDP6733039.1 phosphate ABC transporter permease subunit PstC [Gammaproteobacteria bacterium]HAJ76789.1 phosphate ABC transporter permease subunit PstC [Gammaproteobacteria bacterium]|tara:strand:- start:6348 stop:7298 length:951 start_codon:yes stop_codon:yes gene_type:complete